MSESESERERAALIEALEKISIFCDLKLPSNPTV
jgi:hypothetical protein